METAYQYMRMILNGVYYNEIIFSNHLLLCTANENELFQLKHTLDYLVFDFKWVILMSMLSPLLHI